MEISQNLIDAVNRQDIVAIRSSFYTILLSDPRFATNKFDAALEYVNEHNVNDFMDQNDGKVLKPESEWDQVYFDLLSSELQDVFSEERIQQLKKVSKVIYDTEKKKINNKNIESKSKDYTTIGLIGLAIVMFLTIRHLFKGGK